MRWQIKPRKVPSARETQTEVTKPSQAAALLYKLIAFDDLQERFAVISLTIRNTVLSSDIVAVGTSHSVVVHPRDVFRAAIKANAAGIVLAHNHPSRDLTPSADDFVLTERLRKAGDVVGIPVVDHIIVASDRRYASILELDR